MNLPLLRKPSALAPIAMSVTALTLVVVHTMIFGVVREADEGTGAHIWQILMGGQAPVIAYFALRWFPSAPAQALVVLALQIAAALAACAPVYLLRL